MDAIDYTRYVFALVAVLGVLTLGAFIMRRAAGGWRNEDDRRLRVVESLMIDPKKRLLLIERDKVEHLILLSGDNAHFVERRIRKESPTRTVPKPPSRPKSEKSRAPASPPPADAPAKDNKTANADAPPPPPPKVAPARTERGEKADKAEKEESNTSLILRAFRPQED